MVMRIYLNLEAVQRKKQYMELDERIKSNTQKFIFEILKMTKLFGMFQTIQTLFNVWLEFVKPNITLNYQNW